MSLDDKYFISGSEDKSIKIFDRSTNKQVYHFKDAHEGKLSVIQLNLYILKGAVTKVLVSRDNKYIISGSEDKTIKMFDLHRHTDVFHFKNPDAGAGEYSFATASLIFSELLFSLTLSRDNKYIISGSSDGVIRMFNIETRTEVYNFKQVHEGKYQSFYTYLL